MGTTGLERSGGGGGGGASGGDSAPMAAPHDGSNSGAAAPGKPLNAAFSTWPTTVFEVSGRGQHGARELPWRSSLVHMMHRASIP
jgi:hypothetical protein